jgi:hypothetical protein
MSTKSYQEYLCISFTIKSFIEFLKFSYFGYTFLYKMFNFGGMVRLKIGLRPIFKVISLNSKVLCLYLFNVQFNELGIFVCILKLRWSVVNDIHGCCVF